MWIYCSSAINLLTPPSLTCYRARARQTLAHLDEQGANLLVPPSSRRVGYEKRSSQRSRGRSIFLTVDMNPALLLRSACLRPSPVGLTMTHVRMLITFCAMYGQQ